MITRNNLRRLFVTLGLCAGLSVAAADAPSSPEAASEATRLAAQHAHRVDVDDLPQEDPVVFTDISPYATDETPVRLPDDQAVQ
jgi:hypothetical protein